MVRRSTEWVLTNQGSNKIHDFGELGSGLAVPRPSSISDRSDVVGWEQGTGMWGTRKRGSLRNKESAQLRHTKSRCLTDRDRWEQRGVTDDCGWERDGD